jgi:hypothetical protein
MKKLTLITAGLVSFGCLGAFEMSTLDLNADVKFSTVRAFRGRRGNKRVISSNLELGLLTGEKGRVYAGVDGAFSFEPFSLAVDRIRMAAYASAFPRGGDGGDAGRLRAAASALGAFPREGDGGDTEGDGGDTEGDGGDPFEEIALWGDREVSPYLGFSYGITDIFTLDCGCVWRFWPSMPSELREATFKNASSEAYVGIAADVLLSPSVYFAYNFDWKEMVAGGRIAHTCDLGKFGLNGFAVKFGAKVGYDKADRPYGINAKRLGELAAEATGRGEAASGLQRLLRSALGVGKAHWFYGANADLIYSFNKHARVRVGVEMEGNFAQKKAWQNLGGFLPSKTIWFNAAFDCSF